MRKLLMIEHGGQDLGEVLRLYIYFFWVCIKVGIKTIDKVIVYHIEHFLGLCWEWVSEVHKN